MFWKTLCSASLLWLGFQTSSAQALSPDVRQMQQDYAQQNLIHSFYEAFARRDAEAMVALYHPEIRFSDPVFGLLQGQQAGDMWRMLIQGSEGRQLDISHSQVHVSAGQGQARWEARYVLAATHGRVHNRIQARFAFRDGLIIEHHDSFDLARWNCMALGPVGCFLGGQPWLQGQMQNLARRNLAAYQSGQ